MAGLGLSTCRLEDRPCVFNLVCAPKHRLWPCVSEVNIFTLPIRRDGYGMANTPLVFHRHANGNAPVSAIGGAGHERHACWGVDGRELFPQAAGWIAFCSSAAVG
jgi:hypothetical protein